MPDAATGIFAERLRGLRLSRRLSQAELGRSIGVSARTIRALENGRYVPSVTLARHLAQALGQSVEAVFAP